MLFILTGDIQTGKTRWLEESIGRLSACGVVCAGVLAPGDWVASGEGFDKRGIDNVLLPEGRRIPFARRRDLALLEGGQEPLPQAQSERAQLGWLIDDEAIDAVNEHFRGLRAAAEAPGAVWAGAGERGGLAGSAAHDGARSAAPGGAHGAVRGEAQAARVGQLLVVDELGRLELIHGGGLVDAMALLACGGSERFPHALVVVRSSLADAAEERFAEAWGGIVRIVPREEAYAALKRAMCG